MISIGLWVVLGYSLVSFLAYLKHQAIGIIAFKAKIDQKLNMRAYNAFKDTRHIEDEDFELFQQAPRHSALLACYTALLLLLLLTRFRLDAP